MHAVKLLHKIFREKLPTIHKKRLEGLMDAVETLIRGSKLTLTSIGRNVLNNAKVKSNIKKIDRLLKNKNLHKERFFIYNTICNFFILENTNPWIHVDWSCISSVTNIYLLRASVSLKGRAIVLYEEAHPKKTKIINLLIKNF